MFRPITKISSDYNVLFVARNSVLVVAKELKLMNSS